MIKASQFQLYRPNFIEFGYWDSLKKGLLSGERLYKDLKRMEIVYLAQSMNSPVVGINSCIPESKVQYPRFSQIDLYLKLKEGKSSNTLSAVGLTPPDGPVVDNQTFGDIALGLPQATIVLPQSHNIGEPSTWTIEVQNGTLEAIDDMFIVCRYKVIS